MADFLPASPAGCPFCARRFERMEHMKRHIATHTKERNLDCHICGKAFSRKDALDRHKKVHRPHAPLRRFRACTECATSRVKCSGTVPCVRCQQRATPCRLPTTAENDASWVESASQADGSHGPDGHTMDLDNSSAATHGRPTDGNQQVADFDFSQPPLMPLSIMPGDVNSHMISTLNWVSPNFDFDLTDFDQSIMPSDDQYWDSPIHDEAAQGQESVSHDTPTNESAPTTNGDERPDMESGGTAYVDNAGARRPRNGRYGSRVFEDQGGSPSDSHTTEAAGPPEPIHYGFPSRYTTATPSTGSSLHSTVSEAEYIFICTAFQDHCLAPQNLGRQECYLSTSFPSIDVLNLLCSRYWQAFDPKVVGLLGRHTVDLAGSETSWVLKLAMAAVGSHYMENVDGELAAALHEMLRRTLRQSGATFSHEPLDYNSLALVQAKVLNYIGLAYGGFRRLERFRAPALEALIGEYTSLYNQAANLLRGDATPLDRQTWLLHESARRLCHLVWLLDCMSGNLWGAPPRLLLDHADIALPSKDEDFSSAVEQSPPSFQQPTLEKALRVLYVEKQLIKDVTEYGTILLIHGLYCQTWSVARSLNRPLMRWTPSAHKGNADSQELTSPSWLPRVPQYNHWRNAACDCLDVLHWVANSNIATSGTESSTNLHLHFARVTLLAPHDTAAQLVELLVSGDTRHGPRAELLQKHCRMIERWITEDQYKARLSLIHCGVFFWHLRRYSTDAFYEPTMVYLVTITVWAYGSFLAQRPTRSRASGSAQRDDAELSSDVDRITSIRLDRPTDDELVQLFIKRGRTMDATIMGVGNVASANGPLRMLREGCKLLHTMDKWPIRRQYLATLNQLIQVCGAGRTWLQERYPESARTAT